MEIINTWQELVAKRKEYHYFNRSGVVIMHRNLHAGIAAVLADLTRESDLRMLVLIPEVFEDYGEWFNTINFEQLIEDLMPYNLDLLYFPTYEEFNLFDKNELAVEVSTELQSLLEGSLMPGFAESYLLMLMRVLNGLNPKFVFMGQKDFYKAKLISKLIEDFCLNVDLKVVKTERDSSGAAYDISEAVLFRTLDFVNRMIQNGTSEVSELTRLAKEFLGSFNNFELEKLEFLDLFTLKPVNNSHEAEKILLFIVGKLDGVRVKDNLII